MSTTMRGFAKRIRVIANGIETNSDAMMRKVVITVASAVALRTPVDTGRARSNWRTNIGSAASGVIQPYYPGTKGSTGAANVGSVGWQAETAMKGYTRSGIDVYISNNLPYIGVLNDGSSTQAPAGFIQSAVQAGVDAVRKARLIK